ncbi:hypothetical protein E2562_004394 [Oryza meyeriana var. granulata]|uniref:Uncharacterized protein n=1 Tax=Oryza meyeriana var. granulata TaxID=110450 RepID=A0A6G1CYA4_9ORYZ|nr:hypothetical protein E2562_004394 [Oryza meyeriana var. granulata]
MYYWSIEATLLSRIPGRDIQGRALALGAKRSTSEDFVILKAFFKMMIQQGPRLQLACMKQE